MSALITREEAKTRLSRIGKTAADVARELGVSGAIVRGVLDGTLKGAAGDAHKVAVALGMKDGVIVDDRMSISDAMKAAAA
ncbi:MAG: hypothetical protein ACK4TC_12580 [Sphingomonas pseudosanguinis]|jgi:gp16 family phage-associated protein|uniref:hypothetical protein n=1 Tax=Sphingomonas pseudosanguinis TaxID=413712 RepID=UPI00391A9C4F